ncbi:MAG TPA: VWA domain-containing protein [Pyrinomonadaceae bacterium]|nr:VWA domain-containing protein [Pyrinomonadaceae bacterium]
MRNFFIRIASAFLTFAVGVGAVAALATAARKGPPRRRPAAHADPRQKTLEMVFVLDTTGSMGGLIEGAKQRIWGVVNEVMQSPSRPDVRVGLVAYRDNGDQYVTQILPLTNDLDRVYTTLMDFRAGGGGDWQENVRRALADGVRESGWSRPSPNVAQIIFLVGDAPPHAYRNEPDTIATTAEAVGRGMTVNTIQCGSAADTRREWEQIARRGEGQFFAIAQDGGVQTVATPYDARLSELASRLGSTYMAYGGGAGPAGARFRADADARQADAERKVAAEAPATATADRAANKALNRDAYVGDLLQSIENESVKLDDVRAEDLPDQLQKLPTAERRKEVERRLAERKQLREEIVTLSRQRDEFINAERRKAGGNKVGFDAAVAAALKEQMAKKGIR